jgi:Putative Actinobacterial Holin-X, holin superfamily III
MAGDRAVSDVVQEILDNVQELLGAEVRLARAEVRQDARQAVVSNVWLTAGVVAAGSAWMLTLWAAVFALANALPLWAATLTSGLVLGAAAGVLAVFGWLRLQRLQPLLERTAASVKENLEWLKQSTR